jgi:cellulose synthase/poly-beta-1,6-N-acetylglucosamine synthase-like glycosyltransferase
VHAIILLMSALYVVAHVALGTWLSAVLLEARSPVTALLAAVTVVVAIGNLFVVVPLWVFAAITLVRGPRPLVAPPAPVAEGALPHIVVQIPGRNEPTELVRRSIASVLNADYPREKLGVQFIDNSDDERWREVAHLYTNEPRVSVEHRDGTAGFKAGNLNIGLERLGAFADPGRVLIGLLDVGDTFAPKAIRPMATEFVNNERLGFVQGMFRIGNPRDTIINWSDSYVGDAARRYTEGYFAHYGIPTVNGHCALLRLQAIEDAGGWNESRVAEDWNTGITMIMRGWSGKWVDYEPTNPAMVSTELVPGEVIGQQKQKRRWAAGSAELARHHFVEWMRASLPWNQRVSLFLRFAASFAVVPGIIAQLLLPVWIVFALSGDVSRSVLWFGLMFALLQSPFMLVNTAAAINYARERNWRTAVRVLLAYPVQAFWRLPLFSHAAVGIAEGFSRGLREFVITPKNAQRASLLGTVKSQSPVLLVSVSTLLALQLTLLAWGGEPDPLWLAALALSVLTVCALFLVPLTQWIRRAVLPHFTLPRSVYVSGHAQPWAPSGWMGGHDALTMNFESTESPHSGATCIEVNYSAPDNWAGVAWQHPANDWGDQPGGFDLTGARRLTFWARGREGGEQVDFGVGILDTDRLYPDSVNERLEGVRLKKDWERYTIELEGRDLTQVKSGFFWTLVGRGSPTTFFLDDVRFES